MGQTRYSRFGVPAGEYLRWQDCLADHLMDLLAGQQGGTLTLSVDDDYIAEHFSDFGGVDSLTGSVREVMGTPGTGMFSRIGTWCFSWEKQRARTLPPPSLPVLAVAILAASRMDRDESATEANYYGRLARLLTPPQQNSNYLREHLAGNFKDLNPRWDQLRSWIKSSGWESSIRTQTRLKHVGYPLSQAIVRAMDRRLLTQFWAVELGGSATPPAPPALVDDLKRWSRERELGPRLREALYSDEERAWIGGVLHGIASSWDGRIQETSGRTTRRLRLTAEGVTPGALPSLAWRAEDGKRVDFTADHLVGGVHIASSESYRSYARHIVFMTYRAPENLWVEGPVNPWEPQVLVYHEDAKQPVLHFVRSVLGPKFQQLRPTKGTRFATVKLPALEYGQELDERLAELRKALGIPSIVVGSRPIRTANGLRIHTQLNRNVYLAGGAPDLELPGQPDGPTQVMLAVDGRMSEETADVIEQRVALRALCAAPGSYEISVGGTAIAFSLVSDAEVVGGRAASRAVLWRPGAWEPVTVEPGSTASHDLDGGDLARPDSRVFWAPARANESLLIGPNGHLRRLPSTTDTGAATAHQAARRTQRLANEGWLAYTDGLGAHVVELAPLAPSSSPGSNLYYRDWLDALTRYVDCCDTPAWRILLDSVGISSASKEGPS